MKFIRANDVCAKQLLQFLRDHPAICRKQLLEAGYVVQIKENIIGCFILQSVDGLTSYWLQQLYMVREHVAKLPVLLESIIQLAKSQDVKRVYVHSREPGVDVLLEALQFTEQTERQFAFQQKYESGSWWTYSVS